MEPRRPKVPMMEEVYGGRRDLLLAREVSIQQGAGAERRAPRHFSRVESRGGLELGAGGDVRRVCHPFECQQGDAL